MCVISAVCAMCVWYVWYMWNALYVRYVWCVWNALTSKRKMISGAFVYLEPVSLLRSLMDTQRSRPSRCATEKSVTTAASAWVDGAFHWTRTRVDDRTLIVDFFYPMT